MSERASETTEPDTRTAPKKISQRTIIVAVVIAALVLAAVAVLIFVLGGDDDDGPDTSNFAGQSTSAVPPGTSASALPSASARPGPGGGTPEDAATVQVVAEQVVQAFNAHDPDAVKKVSCDQEATDLSIPAEAKVELVSAPELTSDTATVELRLTIGESSTTIPLPLRKQDGNWCAG